MVEQIKTKFSVLFLSILCMQMILACGVSNQKPIKSSTWVARDMHEQNEDDSSLESEKNGSEKSDFDYELSFNEFVNTTDQIAKIQEEIRLLNESISNQNEKQKDFDARLLELEANILQKEERISGIEIRLRSVEEQFKIITALESAVVALEERIQDIELNVVKRAEFEALKKQVGELSHSQNGTVSIIKSVVTGLTLLASEIGFPIAEMIIGS